MFDWEDFYFKKLTENNLVLKLKVFFLFGPNLENGEKLFIRAKKLYSFKKNQNFRPI